MRLLDKLLGVASLKALRKENEYLIRKLDEVMRKHDSVLHQLEKCRDEVGKTKG